MGDCRYHAPVPIRPTTNRLCIIESISCRRNIEIGLNTFQFVSWNTFLTDSKPCCRITSENGVGAKSRMGSACRADVLPLVAVGSAHWCEPADAICGPGGAPSDSVPRHLRYRRLAGGSESRRSLHLSAARPCVFNSLFQFLGGCLPAAYCLCRAFDWNSAHCCTRPSCRTAYRQSCPCFRPKSAPASRVIFYSFPS
jgi:hypothetical protein